MTIITTGITTDRVLSRRDLRDFLKDEDSTTLYLLAIEQMQKTDQQDLSSWFQIAGIHGRPYIPYDNVGELGTFGGYCTHSSILFPTWHRPYLALFEQSITGHILDIANRYSDPADKQRYVAAAERFRIPYWDWASDSTLPESIASQETITLHAPDGDRTIKNPLYSYMFNPLYADFGDGLPDEKTWEAWQTTLRYPTTKDARAKSQPRLMEGQLSNNHFTLRDRTYNLLTQSTDYAAFSHDGFAGDDQDPSSFDSLESIHDQVHGLVGADGHMGVIDYAAFDPVFWLHHTQVDRLFALWQFLNPDSFVVPTVTQNGTFTTTPGSTEDSKSPLTPFRTPDGFWDSDSVRDTATFKYTYPELEDWDANSPEESSARLRLAINRLYGNSAPVARAVPSIFKGLSVVRSAATKGSAPPAQAQAPLKISKEVPESDTFTFTDAQPTTKDDKTHYHEWIANIVVEKYAVNTSFFIHIFIGEFNDDPQHWGLEQNLVGSHVIFANNTTFSGCERCRDAHEKHKRVTGTIPLTGALYDRLGPQAVLEPEVVVPYLQKHLHWRIQRHDGTAIAHADVPSLKISVGHAVVDVPSSASEFATWGDVQIHHAVTAGRPGGASASL